MAEHRWHEKRGHSRRHSKNFINLSYCYAKELSVHRHSCMEEVEHETKLAMPLKYICNIPLGLKETLNKQLFIFHNQLNGVPMAFDKIKILNSQIIDDQEFFNLSIKVSFIVFKPAVGKLLCGIINKISKCKCISKSCHGKRHFDVHGSVNWKFSILLPLFGFF